MKANHIFLIGFMGSGKSCVGILLARTLSLPFADLDKLIVDSQGQSISSIFETYGESYFRELETRLLWLALDAPPRVLALGGGTLVDSETHRNILQHGLSVWLKVSAHEALKRCYSETGRPLAQDPTKFMKLYEKRQPIYQDCDFHVNVDKKLPESICREIVKRLKKAQIPWIKNT